MKRAAIVVALVAIVAIAVYWFALRGSSTPSAAAQPPRAVAQIGEGKQVILIGDDGRVMGSRSAKSKPHLPVLALKQAPQSGRVRGHVAEEVRILAAAPRPLRRYLATASYAKTGVDVELTTGIEIRFGDAGDAARKWKAAAAVLADPSVTLLSYVDVTAPTRPSFGGEGHELPPAS